MSLSDFFEDLLTGASRGAHVVIDPTHDLISLLSACNFSILRVILAFGVPQVKVMRGLFNVQDVNVRVADYRHCEAVILLSRLGAGPHKAVRGRYCAASAPPCTWSRSRRLSEGSEFTI